MPSESRSRNGWRKTARSSLAPGNRAITRGSSHPHFSAVTSSSSAATMYTAPATSAATYSNLGWKAMAMLAGMVHGVVVQISP